MLFPLFLLAGFLLAPLAGQAQPAEATKTDASATTDASGKQADVEARPVIPPVYESIVITAAPVDPHVERRTQAVFREGLFSRDDQVFHLLDAGINAGQHEGGGKSLEIRRFGFNLDHGGVNGGLKVLVDGVQQNQGTQGHGQGYLGALKTLTPELVEDVEIVNGPFNAEYGDFSGLGVVHIRTKEVMPDLITGRFMGGAFDTWRGVLVVSPEVKHSRMLFSYEGSAANGPFLHPLDYRRDSGSGSWIRSIDDHRQIGMKFNVARYHFNSSGQIPLDEVAAGRLHRFGAVSPGDGGETQSGRISLYHRHEFGQGEILKLEGYLERSLWDLYSNFTFYLNNPLTGDGIQQHDSRLQEGLNLQYVRPQITSWGMGIFTAGVGFLDSQMNVGLYERVQRTPYSNLTKADARVTNPSLYAQESFTLWRGKLTAGGGLRYDSFRYQVNDLLNPTAGGVTADGRWQPKASVAFTPFAHLPLGLHFNYGRGINSLDARGVVQREPGMPAIAATDFMQSGISLRAGRVSFVGDYFHIRTSNQLVYIPDDGSLDFAGPSFAHGWETKATILLTRSLSMNGGLTKVMNAYYRDTGQPRIYVDRAPSLTANAGLTLAGWKGWSASARMRAINSYRLDGQDASLRAAGHTVFDLGLSRRIVRSLDFNFNVDNMLDRHYYETQNYFESRLSGQGPQSRIHATPGYPRTVSAGLTWRIGGK